MKIKIVFIALVNALLILVGVSAYSAELTAFQKLERKAQDGELDAQFRLANAYHKGEIVEKSYKKAYGWLKIASAKGHRGAQFNLASMYFNGEGVEKDVEQGIKWLTKSAEAGVRSAQVHLNELFHRGDLTPKDYKKAAYWAEKAAEQDHLESQYILAVYYDAGHGVRQSDEKSTYWFKKAAKRDHDQAQTRVGLAYLYGIGVKQDLEQAIEWLTKSASKDDNYSQSLLIQTYEEAGIEAKKAYWSSRLAKSGNADSMFMLAKYYYSKQSQSGYKSAYVWSYLMGQYGANTERLLAKLSLKLAPSEVDEAILEAKKLQS